MEPPAYEVTTTAGVVYPATLCFETAVTDPDVFGALRVMHGENGAWVDRTVSRDSVLGTLCAEVNSLSPFVLARQHRDYVIRFLFDASRSFKAAAQFP